MRLLIPCIVSHLALSAVVSTAVSAQAPDWQHRQPLPTPTGRYAVGTLVAHLVDSTRGTSRRWTTRPLTVQLWYPAVQATGTVTTYLQEPALLDSMMLRGYLDLTPEDMAGWKNVALHARLRAVSVDPTDPGGWPVVVLSHGMGVARAHYSALSAELASHGFVVLTIDHPIGGFTLDPQGRVLTPGVDTLTYGGPPLPFVVRDWATDADFVVRTLVRRARLEPSSLLPRIDTTRLGMLGHSLGGAAALQACRSAELVKVCADMDGYPFGDVELIGVGRPFLTLLSQPDRRDQPPARDSAEAAARERFAEMGRERDSLWTAIGARNATAAWFVVKLTGTGHFSFSDAPFQMPALLRDVGATLPPMQVHERVSGLLLDFFNHFLRGQPLRQLSSGVTTRQ